MFSGNNVALRTFTRERGSRKEKERIVLCLCAAAVFLSSLYIVWLIKETELGMTGRTHGTDVKSVKTFSLIFGVATPWVIGYVMECVAGNRKT